MADRDTPSRYASYARDMPSYSRRLRSCSPKLMVLPSFDTVRRDSAVSIPRLLVFVNTFNKKLVKIDLTHQDSCDIVASVSRFLARQTKKPAAFAAGTYEIRCALCGGAGPCLPTVVPAHRGTSSKSPRFFRHRRRFGDFPAEGSGPYGLGSPSGRAVGAAD